MNSGSKVEFEKFNGKESFSMWKVRMEDLLVQNFLDVALEKWLEGMMDWEWLSLEKRGHVPPLESVWLMWHCTISLRRRHQRVYGQSCIPCT